jgi:hypothetical protein
LGRARPEAGLWPAQRFDARKNDRSFFLVDASDLRPAAKIAAAKRGKLRTSSTATDRSPNDKADPDNEGRYNDCRGDVSLLNLRCEVNAPFHEVKQEVTGDRKDDSQYAK